MTDLLPGHARRFLTLLPICMLSACGMMGDTGAIKDATNLAIACRTDDALDALDRAEQGGGLGMYVAVIERIGILRDAGRDGAAADALEKYKATAGDAYDEASVEESLSDFVTDLRARREKKTGNGTCP